MPNRIIKESICTSEEIDSLSPQAEILFYRLMVKADDYGLYFGNPKIIKSMCYPLKSSDIKDNQINTWLEELSKCDLIRFYKADDCKVYIKLTKWEFHQQIRAKKSKFPMPDINGYHMISDDYICPRNPIQSNPNTRTDADDFFDSVWSLLPSHPNDVKREVKPTRRKELMKIGYERIKSACESYLEKQPEQYRHKRNKFFNDILDNYLTEESAEPPTDTGGTF